MNEAERIELWGSDLRVIFKEKGGQDPPKPLSLKGVAGGISWPSSESPGYFCVIGQSPFFSGNKKYVHLLHEFESTSLDEFTERLMDVSRNMQCADWYDSLAESTGGSLSGYRQYIDEYMDRRGCEIRPFHNPKVTWQIGVLVIQEYAREGALKEIPKQSILARQLGQMTREHLSGGMQPGFHALNALKGVLVEIDWNPLGMRVDMARKPVSWAGWT